MSDLKQSLTQQLASMWTVSADGCLMPSSPLHMTLIWRHLIKDGFYPYPWKMTAFYCACRLALIRPGDNWALEDLVDDGDDEFLDAILYTIQDIEASDFMKAVNRFRGDLEIWLAASQGIPITDTGEV